MKAQNIHIYKEFKDRHVILTGGTGGIGSLVLNDLLKNGAKVCSFIHSNKKYQQSENYNQYSQYEKNQQLLTIQTDLSNPTTITTKFKEAMIFLKGKLDHLIMCHGLFIYGAVTQISVEDFDKVYNLNVRSNFHLLSLSVPFLKITKGNVVMISSVESKIVEKDDFLQSVSKTMINSMVQSAALELAHFGVRINAVAPAFVNTQYRVSKWMDAENNEKYLEQMGTFFLLENKPNEANEISDTILFLASDESSFMTGEIVVVDGGYELNHDLSFKQIVNDEIS